MRIVVAGIGGVGGYIGAHLCKLEDEVLFLARGEHAEVIREEGLLIKEDHHTFRAHPDAVIRAEELDAPIDLLLICVKSYDIEVLITTLSAQITPSTLILPFSNGVEHQQIIEKMVDAKVLKGAVYILAHKASAGVVVKKGKVFAALFGDHRYEKECKMISGRFSKAGLRHKTEGDIEVAIWKKYLFISAFGALTSYFDTSMKKVYQLHQNWANLLLQEVADVAAGKGIDIQDEVAKALKTASALPEDASSSMHLDFQNGAPTELETLCGYIVREGKKQHLPTPLMAKIYGVLSKKQNKT